MTTPKPATVHTQQANAPRDLGMDDRDFDRARQGLIAQHPTGVLEGPLGVAWAPRSRGTGFTPDALQHPPYR